MRVGRQQRLELRHVGRLFAEPHRPGVRLQHHGHAVVELGAQFVGLRRDDGEAANAFARRRAPGFPQPGHPHQPAILQRDRVRLLAGSGLLPFVKAVERHQAAPALKRFAEGRLGVDLFRAGVDGRETDLNVFRP